MIRFVVARDDASDQFFDAAADGVLLIRRCPACGTAFAPQQPRCTDGTALEWQPASGVGTLVSWAIEHGTPLDPVLASPGGERSTYGLVELAEGPWLQVPLVDVTDVVLVAGMPMSVRFVRPGDGEPIPAFAPLQRGEGATSS